MSIIVLTLIVNSAFLLDFAVAEKTDKEDKELKKEQKIQEIKNKDKPNDKSKEFREGSIVTSSDSESEDKVKKFREGTVVTSSSTTSTDKVTICHIPPGNPENAHTITVGSASVTAHYEHGDYVDGSCDSAPSEYLEDGSDENEIRASEDPSVKESKAKERAERIVEKLQRQIESLENRLQNLIEKFELGEYYGNISNTDDVINSYVLEFEGTALSIYDEDITTEMSGKLFMENQVTSSETTKYKVPYGEIIVGENVYDVAFGKSRLSENTNSLVLVLQTMDSELNENTIKMTLAFEDPINEEFGDTPEEFTITENSIISKQWYLEGTGSLSIGP